MTEPDLSQLRHQAMQHVGRALPEPIATVVMFELNEPSGDEEFQGALSRAVLALPVHVVASPSPVSTPDTPADIEADLTARLAAADLGWSRETGDPAAEPDYIRALARQVAAFAPSYLRPATATPSPVATPDTREAVSAEAIICAGVIVGVGGESDPCVTQEQADRATRLIVRELTKHGLLRPARATPSPVAEGGRDAAQEFVLYPPAGWLNRIDEVIRYHLGLPDGSPLGEALARLIRSWEGMAARDADGAPDAEHWGPKETPGYPFRPAVATREASAIAEVLDEYDGDHIINAAHVVAKIRAALNAAQSGGGR